MPAPSLPPSPPRSDPGAERPRIGVSACLLGEAVRFDAGHKRDPFLMRELGRHVSWVPVCPEVETGMGTPREAVRLVGDPQAPRMVGNRSGRDWTDALRAWSAQRLEQLAAMDLDGFVLAKNSPSCGMERVRVYGRGGAPSREGTGLFAAELMRRFPLLPVEEQGRLNDPLLRENFVERIFVHRRFRDLLRDDPTPAALVRFHTVQKLAVLAHCPRTYRQMGRVVAAAGRAPFDEVAARYGELLMTALARKATPGRHANVLEHLVGHLKRDLTSDEKAELVGLVHDYRRGLVPLVVPVTLLAHHFRRSPGGGWARTQTYLDPYPRGLMLRNAV